MNDLGQIDKLDKYRTLLTEVLPYETPLWFTNVFFHKVCKNSGFKNIPPFIKNYFLDEDAPKTKNKARIPLNYRIKKDTIGERELSIMHPSIVPLPNLIVASPLPTEGISLWDTGR